MSIYTYMYMYLNAGIDAFYVCLGPNEICLDFQCQPLPTHDGKSLGPPIVYDLDLHFVDCEFS